MPQSQGGVPAPTGLVTLVFSDVQGSTVLWDKAPDLARACLAVHDVTLRTHLAQHQGYEVKTEGDGFMVAFQDPRAAVAWCVAVQRALHDAEWPGELSRLASAREEGGFRGLRVRMGAHRGEPLCERNERTRLMDYFGPDVNRAARIAQAAHGGQVLLGASLIRAVDSVPDVVVTRMGTHRLRGLEDPEEIWQVLPAVLKQRTFPPIRSVPSENTNLPRTTGLFVGREATLDVIDERFGQGHAVVTVLGPGGMGKTRVALRYASTRLHHFASAGGAWFCDLSDAVTREGVLHAVTLGLRLPASEQRDLEGVQAQIGHALAGRAKILVVLDNAEQVVQEVAACVDGWHRRAPDARFLVTSRIPLHLETEGRVELPPLALPDAVSLFEGYASALKRGFTVDNTNRAAVRRIADMLDRIPLALRLAAGRITVLAPEELQQRLTDRFKLLSSRDAGLPERHSTLRRAIDWSWDLMDTSQRELLAQLSVFQASFGLADAESVAVLTDRDAWLLDVLQSLREGSLLHDASPVRDQDDSRYLLYQSVREYAAEKLDESGQRASTEQRHRAWALRRGTELVERYRRRGDTATLARLEQILEDLLAVHRRVGTPPADAARAALHVAPVLLVSGTRSVHLELLDRALSAAEASDDRDLLVDVLLARAEAYRVRGQHRLAEADAERARAAAEGRDPVRRARVAGLLAHLARQSGQMVASEGLAREALTVFERGEEHAAEAAAMHVCLGSGYHVRGDLTAARAAYQRAQELLERLGEPVQLASATTNLGVVSAALGDTAAAERHYARASELAEGANHLRAKGRVWMNLANLEMDLGRLTAARHHFRAALDLHRRVGDRRFEGTLLGNLALLDLEEHNWSRAASLLDEAAGIHRETGNRWNLASVLVNQAILAMAERRYEAALDAIRDAEGILDELADSRAIPVARLHRAAILAALGRVDEATDLFLDLRRAGLGAHEALASVLEGFLDTAQAELAMVRGGPGAVDAPLQAARDRLERAEQASATRTSAQDVRMAMRVLAAKIEAIDPLVPTVQTHTAHLRSP